MRIILLLTAAICATGVIPAESALRRNKQLRWHISYSRAVAEAKKEDKLVLAFFTGSDWCGYCKKLKGQVFSKSEFERWARENVVLLELDFPHRKAQSSVTKRQNKKLKKKYKPSGYPTIVLLSPEGKVLYRRTGYGGESVEAWLEDVQRVAGVRPRLKPIEPYQKLVEGLTFARENNHLLLLILTEQPSSLQKRNLGKLFNDPGFIKLVADCITVVRVDLSSDSRLDQEDKRALETVRKRHELKEAESQILLLDLYNDKLLYITSSIPSSPRLLTRTLEQAKEDFHLVKTKWGYRDEYAKFSPDGKSLGSWSVALGQILYYHRLAPAGKVSYQCTEGYSITEDFEKKNFRWKLFVNDFEKMARRTSVNEVAKYLYFTSVVVRRNFGKSNYLLNHSERAAAIAQYYGCQAKLYSNSKYSSAQTKKVIADEIEAGRLVMMCLRDLSKENYRAVVVDACHIKDDNFWVYINMGKAGSENGWYNFAEPILEFNDNDYRKILTIKPNYK